MVTINAAKAVQMDDVIGVLDTGRFGDVSIFAGHGKDPFRAVLDAEPKDVALVLRAGVAMYGDAAMVGALATSCDAIDVCGNAKQVCIMGDLKKPILDYVPEPWNKYPPGPPPAAPTTGDKAGGGSCCGE